MRRSRIVRPLVWSRTIPAPLRSNNKTAGIGKQGLRNQLLIHVGAVGIGSVNEIHTELHCSAENCYRLGSIFRWTPDALSRETHRPEPETMDGNFSAERKASSQTGRYFSCVHDVLHSFHFT